MKMWNFENMPSNFKILKICANKIKHITELYNN